MEDTSVNSSLAAPQHKSTLFVFLAAVVILAGAIWAYYFFVARSSHTLPIMPFAVSVGTVPASRLYIENPKTTLLEPLTLLYNEDQLSVLDIVKGANGFTYYILADKSPVPVGNIYKKDSQGVVTKITNSQTAKYNLAYNPIREELVYQSLAYVDEKQFVSTRDWSLTTYSKATQKEQTIAKGSNPIFTPDNTLTYRSGENIVILNLNTNATSSIFSLKDYPVYAMHVVSHELYAFNRKTFHIDIFVISPQNGFSYKKSISVAFTPTVLSFVGDVLYAGTVEGKSQTEKKYLFAKVKDHEVSPVFSVNAIEGLAAPQRIYAYE
jgi:hypothetical protein